MNVMKYYSKYKHWKLNAYNSIKMPNLYISYLVHKWVFKRKLLYWKHSNN